MLPRLSSRQKKLIAMIVYALLCLITGFFSGCAFYGRYSEGGKTIEVGGTVEKPATQPRAGH